MPTATYEVGGDRFLQYEDQTSTIYPGDPFWGGRYRRFGGPIYSPPLVVTRTCAITFACGTSGSQLHLPWQWLPVAGGAAATRGKQAACAP